MQWYDQHRQIEQRFLAFIGGNPPLILKGGTALMVCYGLNRFSEDLDFDASHRGVSTIKLARSFCSSYGYDCRVRKDTPSVQRVMVDYGGVQPLKIETSSRRAYIAPDEATIVNSVRVYTLDRLAQFKRDAYLARDKVRDLFDITFIINNHWDKLSYTTQLNIIDALSVKGLEQFDAVISQNVDPLIDNEILAEQFLEAYDKLNLIRDTQYSLPPHEQFMVRRCES